MPNRRYADEIKSMSVKQCPKCKTLCRMQTVCFNCLEEMRLQHMKHYVLWGIEAEDLGRFSVTEVIDMFNQGFNAVDISLILKIEEETVRWIKTVSKEGFVPSITRKPKRYKYRYRGKKTQETAGPEEVKPIQKRAACRKLGNR